MTRTRVLLMALTLFVADVVSPRAQSFCAPPVKTIWFDLERDATSGVQTLTNVRLCLDGVLVSAPLGEIVNDEIVIRGATVTIPRDVAGSLARGRRQVIQGDQLKDLPQQ